MLICLREGWQLLKYLCSPAQTSPEAKLVSAFFFFFLWIWNFNSNLWRWLPKETKNPPELHRYLALFYPKGLICGEWKVLSRRAARFSLRFQLMQMEIKTLACVRLVCLMNCDMNAHFTPACFLFHSLIWYWVTPVTSVRFSKAEVDAQVTTTTLESSWVARQIEMSVKDARFFWNSTWICSLLFFSTWFSTSSIFNFLPPRLWGAPRLIPCFRLH